MSFVVRTDQNDLIPVNGTAFIALLVSEFPKLESEVQEDHGLVHLQMGTFVRHTQSAIDSRDMSTLDRCLALAHHGFRDADPVLKNAFYVSYLEHLNFAGSHGAMSQKRMTPLLQSGCTEITNYMERLSRSSKKSP